MSTLLSFWSIHRGRRCAVRRLRPFFDRGASGAGPRVSWSDGFGLGLLTTSITLAAREEVGELDSDALGLVQVGAWADLTGLDPDLVGARIALLSLDEDPAFLAGCRAAIAFAEARRAGEPSIPDDDGGPGLRADASDGDRIASAALSALWERIVDAGPSR